MSIFTILHVCVGNICRSPMAERLLVKALRERVGDRVEELYRSHGAGTGTWHVGEAMNPPAAAEVLRRGGDPGGFVARHLSAELIDESDLVLCATAEQAAAVVRLQPGARGRTFVLGELGRLLPIVAANGANGGTPSAELTGTNGGALSAELTGQAAHARGAALVAALDAARAGAPPRHRDDLADPYGLDRRAFAQVADEIEATVVPLAAALTEPPRG
jgi:protein-tyrosine phosphatase